MTYHINNANKLEVKRDCNRSRVVDNRVCVFVVVFKQIFVESRLIRFHCSFCKPKRGKRDLKINLERCYRVFEISWTLILSKHAWNARASEVVVIIQVFLMWLSLLTMMKKITCYFLKRFLKLQSNYANAQLKDLKRAELHLIISRWLRWAGAQNRLQGQLGRNVVPRVLVPLD